MHRSPRAALAVALVALVGGGVGLGSGAGGCRAPSTPAVGAPAGVANRARATGATPTPTASVRGWGALVIDDTAFVIGEDFASVAAYDIATGRARWRTRLPAPTRGRHTLHALAGAVALWAGDQLVLLSPATGALVRPPEPAPWNDRCFLATGRGVCAFRCDCDVRIVDCTTARVVGKVYDETYVDFEEAPAEDGGGGGGGCYGGGGDIVGRAGPLAVFSIEDLPRTGGADPFGAPLAFVAVDTTTGREAYRIPAAPLTSTVAPPSTGVTADGATCYAGDHVGALLVWDCASGRILWRLPAASASDGLPGHLVQTSAAPRGLFRRAGADATLYDERTGAVRWTRTAPLEQVTLLAGAPTPTMIRLAAPSAHRTTELVWLDADGAPGPSVPLAASPTEADDGDVLLRTPAGLSLRDALGRERAATASPLPVNVTFVADHLDLFGTDELVVVDRALTPRVRVTGSAASAPGSTLPALAIYRWPAAGSTEPGEILLYALKP